MRYHDDWNPVSELPETHEAGIFRESMPLLLKMSYHDYVMEGKCRIMPDGEVCWTDDYNFVNRLITHWKTRGKR